jgi:PEGA domain
MYRRVGVLCCLLVIFPMTEVSAVPQQKSSATVPDQSPAAACKQPCLEDGTPIKLRIAQTVSSADAHVNDRVEFEVLEEIRISGVLIVPKGGIALGTVTEAQPKRRMARGGKLEIVMDSVRLADGEKAALRATKGGNGGGHVGAMTAGIVATALVCFVCAPLFLLIHGKDITIPKGTEIPTFVDGNMPLDLAKFQEDSSPSQQVQANPPASGGVPGAVSQANAYTGIEITSLPTGAEVELDGSFIGNTPSTVGVSPGDHTISVKKKGYKTWERKIKVSSGKVNVFAELEADVKQNSAEGTETTAPVSEESKQKTEPAAPGHPVASVALANGTASASISENLGAVSFTSDPNGAEVYVDDAVVGKSPVTLNLKIGHHYARVSVKGYENWSQQFTIVAGSELRLTAILQKSN